MDILQNQNVLSLNRLNARSTIIPAQKENVFYANKDESDRIIMLTGEYDFKYEDGEWGKLTVPSMWQYHGYGIPRYTNADYIFPFNPPYVGVKNPVGHYRRTFEVTKKYPRMILHFDGVDSAFFVRINGTEVGMSKGSRLPAEFDVSDIVKKGENTIEIDVYTFCDGSYLEAQDMVLGSGIFRDVYIICEDSVSLWDYTVFPSLSGFEVHATFSYGGEEGYSFSASVDGKTVKFPICGHKQEFSFTIDSPKTWNAEEPNLYTLTMKIERDKKTVSVYSKKIGLRTIELKNKHIFCINGTPVKLKGVNRHEHVPDNGRAIDYETTKRELLLLKAHNVNAIRCSHYPNAPYFYELANELGFYVMDEADLETHGCGITGDQGFLSKSLAWREAYIDRERRMYERDKNETCIVIWSLGNECGNGENLVKCAEFMRAQEIKKPILYPQDNGQDPKFADFRQDGYEPPFFIDVRNHETGPWFKGGDTPIVLTEYAHAMGNGPGGLDKYWERIYNYEAVAGGFIWEFKNHGVKHGEDYYYGHDFGECNDCLNFNLDGLCLSDGTPKPSMIEVREIFSPVQVTYNGGIVLHNTNNFRNLSYLKLKWELLENFRTIASGELESIDLPVGKYRMLDLPYEVPSSISDGKKYFVNLSFFDKDRLVCKKQVKLPYEAVKRRFAAEKFGYKYENGTLTADNFSVTFKDGVISHLEKNGCVALSSKMGMSFYRKPTDNDGIKGRNEKISGPWDKSLLAEFVFFPEEEETSEGDNVFTLKYTGKILPEGKFVGYFAAITYNVYADGIITVNMKCKPYGRMPEILPRLGVVFETEKKYSRAIWFGRGEHENYDDRKTSAIFGLYDLPVEKVGFRYDRPQENGFRADTYFAALTDKDGNGGLLVVGADTFGFTAHEYSMANLKAAEHRSELKESDKNYFYVDYKMRGLGSASCGPQPMPEFELKAGEFEFSFIVKPYEGIDDAERVASLDFGLHSQTVSDKYEYTPINTVRENFESRD